MQQQWLSLRTRVAAAAAAAAPPPAGMHSLSRFRRPFHGFVGFRDHAEAAQRGTPASLGAGRDGPGLGALSRLPACFGPVNGSQPDTCSACCRDSSRLGSADEST